MRQTIYLFSQKAIEHLSAVGLLVASGLTAVATNFYTPVAVVAAEPISLLETGEVLGTQTRFAEEIVERKSMIAFRTRKEVDPEKDACSDEEIKQQGKEGERTRYTRVIYYDGEKYAEEIDRVVVTDPVDKVVVAGGKKIYKTLDTPSGQIQYWCKLENFVATSYDSTCRGCDTVTAIGMKQGFGVVAVDPKVIPLRSRLYISGYGVAVAGDTGGLIKGNRIDLGYDSLMGQWSKRNVDVYLL